MGPWTTSTHYRCATQAQRRTSADASTRNSATRNRRSCAGSCLPTSWPATGARAADMAGPTSPASTEPRIPDSHVDFLTRPLHGVLTTMMPDGQPQSSLVWVDCDGECALVNTTRQRRKGRNIESNPKVSLLIVDPANTGRFIQIRGLAELV